MFEPIKKEEVAEVRPGEKREMKLLGSIIPKSGHTVFEVNMVTGEIEPVKFKEVDVHFGSQKVRKTVKQREGCIYISALNRKNVIKKLLRNGFIPTEDGWKQIKNEYITLNDENND